MNEENTVEQAFYQDCAKLLGTEHDYQPYPYRRRNRWNNRVPGNGRFPGFGLIRLFGDRVHIQLRSPVRVNLWCSRDDALEYLKALCSVKAQATTPA